MILQVPLFLDIYEVPQIEVHCCFGYCRSM